MSVTGGPAAQACWMSERHGIVSSVRCEETEGLLYLCSQGWNDCWEVSKDLQWEENCGSNRYCPDSFGRELAHAARSNSEFPCQIFKTIFPISILILSICLTPKIPWDQKLVNCSLGSMCEEKYFFFNFFFWTSELHISQAFHQHQHIQFRLRMSLWRIFVEIGYHFSCIFWGAPTCSHVAKTAQGLKGRVL
jgi:hypothetical protein